MPSENDRRIARNALYLYGRMMLTVFVSLYTSRVVLEVLGVSDYGIYNIVGGIVIILSFINGTMSGATQRFLNYEMGRGDADRLKNTFSAALTVHLSIAAIVVVLAETIGLWYVNHELVIAPERMRAANWTYQYSVCAAVMTIVQIPFVAAIMAREHMGYYALVAMVNVFLKLGVVLLLIWVAAVDNLVSYGALMFVAAAIVMAMYAIYAVVKFKECRMVRHNDRNILIGMLKFCSWDIFGNLCFTTRVQGMLVILNRFGGTVLNAAGGLCLTVGSTVSSFAGAVTSAFRPQIIQQYAAGNYPYTLTLLTNCARYCLLLLGLLIIPLIACMDQLLELWLVAPPPFTSHFCRIALIAACGEVLNTVIGTGVHATGNVIRISFISGSLYLVELPVMWLLLYFTGYPPAIYATHLVMVFVIVYVNSRILLVQWPYFRIGRFWHRGIATPLLIIAAAGAATWLVTILVAPTLVEGVITTLLKTAAIALTSTLSLALLSWFFAIDAEMRSRIASRLHLRK